MFLDWVYNNDPALVMGVLVAAGLAGATVCLTAVHALVGRGDRADAPAAC
jgi:hypothetical protein